MAGYKIYYGTASGNYQRSVEAGNVTSYTLSDLAIGETYYAAATAYTTSGLESTYSNEVMFTVSSSTYAISTSSKSFSSSGGTGSVSVTVPGGVAWTATESLDWVTITSGSSGVGPGTVTFSVSPCAGSGLQVGTMMVADQTFTVTQFCGGIMPVYRFNNTAVGYGDHFYTIDPAEVSYIMAHYPFLVYEGIAFYAYEAGTTSTVPAGTFPVYRFNNTAVGYGDHFYTIDPAEVSYIMAHYSFLVYEGIAFYAYGAGTTSTVPAGTLPVYRFNNTAVGYGEHFYTIDPAEVRYIMAHYPFLVYEGIAFYAYPPDVGN